MSINLSPSQATELLAKIGVAAVVVADESEADKAPDLENMSKAVFNEMETKIKHDVELELKTSARSEEAGKQLGSLRRILKRTFGVDEKTLEGLTMAEMIELSKTTVTSNKENADNDTVKILTEREKEWEIEREKMLADKDAVHNEWRQKYEDRDINERLSSLVESMPRVGGLSNKQAQMIAAELKSNHTLKYNPETKEVELYEKSNPEKRVFEGKNLVTDKYYAEKYLKEAGLYKSDTRNDPPSKVEQGKTNVNAGVHKVPQENNVLAFLEKTFTD